MTDNVMIDLFSYFRRLIAIISFTLLFVFGDYCGIVLLLTWNEDGDEILTFLNGMRDVVD